jgi:hypothetical protein
MKHFIPLTAIAAIVASGTVSAQTPAYSKPSGYVTKQLSVGFNLVSVTLQKAPLFTGSITAVSGATLTFGSAHNLPAGKMLILEVTSGSGASSSVIQEFSTYSGSTITLPSAISGLATGDAVLVRDSVTLEEIFGTALQSGSTPATSDIVWIPSGVGQYDRYYRNTPLFGAAVWKKLNGNNPETNAANTPVVYLDGLFVEVKSSPKTLTVTGQVKTDAVKFAVGTGFNLVGTIFPVGTTLASSGLQASVQSGSTPATSDIIWIPTGPGAFDRYYYQTPLFGGSVWKKLGVTETTVNATTINVPESIFIERKGSAKQFIISPPASYGSL